MKEALIKIQDTRAIVQLYDEQTIVTLAHPEWLLDKMTIRAGMESIAAHTSIPFLTNEDIDDIIRLDAELQEAGKKGDKSAYGALSRNFHRTIIAKCPHKDLYDATISTAQKCYYGRIRFAVKPGTIKNSDNEHDVLIKAIRARDHREAAEITREHFLRIAQEVIEVIHLSEAFLCEKMPAKTSFL